MSFKTTRFKRIKEKNCTQDVQDMLKMLKIEEHEDVIQNTIQYKGDNFIEYKGEDWYILVPREPKAEKLPMLCAHTDTVSNIHPKIFAYTDASEAYICNNEQELMGADDRIGCWIIQQVIKSNPNDFIFALFDMEEIGAIGSGNFIESDSFPKIQDKVSCYLGLDRKGSDEMASYDLESVEFQETLENMKGWKMAVGSFTDVASLAEASKISCINFSVGYYNEHTANEKFSPTESLTTLYMIKHKLPKELWSKTFECVVPNYGHTYFDYEEDYENYQYCHKCGGFSPFVLTPKGYECSVCHPSKKEAKYVTIIKGIINSGLGKTEKVMRDINLVSYFSKFKVLKDDQQEKLDKILDFHEIRI